MKKKHTSCYFLEREIGLAIVLIYEKISDGVFEDEKFYIHYLKKAIPMIVCILQICIHWNSSSTQ